MSRKMKDSGVEWIGEIPEEWSVCRLKSHPQVVSIIAGQSPAGEYIKSEPTGPDYVEFHQGNSLFTSSGQIDRSERYALPGKLAIPQDILVSMRAPVGEIAKSNRPIVMGRGLAAIRGKDNWYKFGYYWMLAIGQELRAQSSGTTFDGISTRFLSNIPVLLLPLSEQQAIADYLDTKVEEIDANISKLKSASALLSELKQSVIYEAVTGKTFEGKVIDRKMKDSGVEWIGEIPEEWSTCRLKDIISLRKGKAPAITDSNAVLPYIDVKALRTGVHDHVASEGVKVLKGSLLILCDGSKSGAVFTSQCEGYLGSTLSVIAHKPIALQSYLTRWLDGYQPIFQANMIGAGIPHLDTDMLKLLHITTPPLSEQQAIADYLDRKVGEIDNKISIIERKIELLAELKQSVIYEAVTGKIDVRAMQ